MHLHASLASPSGDTGSSAVVSQNTMPSVLSSSTPPLLHHHGYVDCPFGATCTEFGGVACAAQPVPLVHSHNPTRLCDSVHQATSQVQRHSRDFGGSPRRTCLARGDCCPPGKGCNRAGPSSREEAGVLQPLRHCTQERWWPPANPGSASLESGPVKLPFKMLTQKRIIRCIQPQNWFAAVNLKDAYFHVSIRPRHRPSVYVRGFGMAVQEPPLRALPVPSCLCKSHEGRPCPVTGSGHQDPQLSRACPARENSCAITGTWCSGTSASWGFGSTGKRASSPPCRETLFSVWS